MGGTLTYTYVSVAGVTLGNTPLVVDFAPCLPASALNTAILVTLPALGAGKHQRHRHRLGLPASGERSPASSIVLRRACSCCAMSTQCSASLSQRSPVQRICHSCSACQALIRVPAELFLPGHRTELPIWSRRLKDKKVRPLGFRSFLSSAPRRRPRYITTAKALGLEVPPTLVEKAKQGDLAVARIILDRILPPLRATDEMGAA
jgi:hypothetical protein